MAHRRISLALLLACMVPLIACAVADPPSSTDSTPLSTPSSATDPAPTPTLTPTPTPPKELTFCLAEEPNTLFVYGNPSRAAGNVLEAIYDGPFASSGYEVQAVVLEKVPSISDGDVVLEVVEVGEGERVVAANGMVVDLMPGAVIRDSGDREFAYEGGSVEMIQMAVTLTLRSDITWADGEPVTADDSVYSSELAGQAESPAVQRLHDRTQSYEAADDRTLVWTGVPGYRDSFYYLNFYRPFPRHIWGGAGIEDLMQSEAASRSPIGWGAFSVEEWQQGDHLTVVRSQTYFRGSEGLPRVDRITFRFVDSFSQAIDWLDKGACDVISQDLVEQADLGLLTEAAVAGRLEIVTSPSSEWEHLDFGVGPAEGDDRPAFFEDSRVRQAVAMCIDRPGLVREAVGLDGGIVANSYVAPEHPSYAGEALTSWEYSPSQGQDMLEQVGWADEDGDGIRESSGVPGIRDGTPFSVTLLTTSGHSSRESVAGLISTGLLECGVGVTVEAVAPEVFFADGPDGPVFGRRFDLALFSWLNGLDVPCSLYLSSEIPAPQNWWAVSNDTGYASEEFDRACARALNTLPGTAENARYHTLSQRIFSRELPALPLYFVPKRLVVRPGVNGVVLDPGESLELWNIEEFDVEPVSDG